MAVTFTTLAQIFAAPFDTVIDVRSPAEFAEDHIPGAVSLPVLSDEERACVGTIYTQDAPFKARKIGAALVARRAAEHIEGPLADKDGAWKPLIYCWRGGQRSGSFASILSQIGWRAEVVEGGYRSYRRLVVRKLHEQPLPYRLMLLDGNTGTAKTEILAKLSERGVQALDLEGLAAHRGSLFGAIHRSQPTQKAFESALALAFEALDPSRPVVVEAESSKIGNVLIPPSIWGAMRLAPRLRLSAPLAARARYLTRAYGDLTADTQALTATLDKLVPFQGHAKVEQWQALANDAGFETLAAELMQQHYDARYTKSRTGQAFAEIHMDDLTGDNLNHAADRIVEIISGH